jgi:hypothetical protein
MDAQLQLDANRDEREVHQLCLVYREQPGPTGARFNAGNVSLQLGRWRTPGRDASASCWEMRPGPKGPISNCCFQGPEGPCSLQMTQGSWRTGH